MREFTTDTLRSYNRSIRLRDIRLTTYCQKETIMNKRYSKAIAKLIVSNLLLLLGIVYRPLLALCLGAMLVLFIQGIEELERSKS